MDRQIGLICNYIFSVLSSPGWASSASPLQTLIWGRTRPLTHHPSVSIVSYANTGSSAIIILEVVCSQGGWQPVGLISSL